VAIPYRRFGKPIGPGDVTRRRMAIPYRRFAVTYRSRGYYAAYSGNPLPTFRDNLSVPGPIGRPETSVRNCHCTLRSISEERRSHPYRDGNLKSRNEFCFIKSLVRVSNEVSFSRRNSRLPWTGITHQMCNTIHTLHPTVSSLSPVHILLTHFSPLWPTSSLPAACRCVCQILHD